MQVPLGRELGPPRTWHSLEAQLRASWDAKGGHVVEAEPRLRMWLHGGCDRQTHEDAVGRRLRRAAQAPGRGEMGCGCLVAPGKGQEARQTLRVAPGLGGTRLTPLG